MSESGPCIFNVSCVLNRGKISELWVDHERTSEVECWLLYGVDGISINLYDNLASMRIPSVWPGEELLEDMYYLNIWTDRDQLDQEIDHPTNIGDGVAKLSELLVPRPDHYDISRFNAFGRFVDGRLAEVRINTDGWLREETEDVIDASLTLAPLRQTEPTEA